MIRLWTVSCALALLLSVSVWGSATAQEQNEILGPWHGKLMPPRNSTGVTVLLTVRKGDDGGLAAVFSQPYSGARIEIPVSSITAKGDTLDFAIARASASFEGRWDAVKHKWEGEFRQGDIRLKLTLEAGKPAEKPVIAGMDGVWQGSIERNGVKLRLILRIATADYGTVVVLDAPDQLSSGEEVPVLSRNGNMIHLGNPTAQFAYDAMLSNDFSRMTGVWKRPNLPDAEVTFTHAATTAASKPLDRPQTPKPPFDYKVEDVAFDNPFQNSVTLTGTLTLPKGRGPFPAAILISGSGANDRDDTMSGHKPFFVIADHLTKHGIAVLRYDDRGVGGSKGDHAVADSADFATDANSATRYLISRPEIRHDAIGFIGHSEGGVTAPVAMASNNQIAFLVMLAGPGTRWDQMVLSQRRLFGLSEGKSEQQLDREQPVIATIYHAIGNADNEAGLKALRALLTPDAMVYLGVPPDTDKGELARRLSSPWARYLFRYDPAPNLKRIRVPVLAMGGTLDQQIPSAQNLPAIKAALVNSPDVTIKELAGLNHFFQTAKTGAVGEYADLQETFSPVALDILTDWLTKRFVKN